MPISVRRVAARAAFDQPRAQVLFQRLHMLADHDCRDAHRFCAAAAKLPAVAAAVNTSMLRSLSLIFRTNY
jgi:hypothetical protein